MPSRKRDQPATIDADEARDCGDASSSSRRHGDRKVGRATKRQRVEDPAVTESPRDTAIEDEPSSGELSSERDVYVTADEDAEKAEDGVALEDDEGDFEDENEDDVDLDSMEYPDLEHDKNLSSEISARPKKTLKALSSKRLEASQKKVKRTGVIYISRVPPFMKPQTVRHLLESFGEIGRIFLTPEDPERHKKRVKAGGNKKKSFTDGWVEFANKKHAKIVAETLNTQIIGGKKGGWYHDDVWNIKYLKGFKWHHLTEQISNENAERASRMRAEISQTTRENKLFLQNVERAKIMEKREGKLKRKLENETGASLAAEGSSSSGAQPKKDAKGFRSQFRQNEVKLKAPKEKVSEQSEEAKRVLSKIF